MAMLKAREAFDDRPLDGVLLRRGEQAGDTNRVGYYHSAPSYLDVILLDEQPRRRAGLWGCRKVRKNLDGTNAHLSSRVPMHCMN